MSETTTPETAVSKRTINKLDAVKTGRLYEWLNAHRDEMSTDKMTKDEVAETASEQLGFPVNGNNIYRLASGMGIKLKGVGDRGERKPAFDPAPLLKEIADLRARVDTLTEWSLKIDARIAEADKNKKGRAA